MSDAPKDWDQDSEARRAMAWTRLAGELHGLDPEQVAAIPRLIGWLTTPRRNNYEEVIAEQKALLAIFPRRDA